MADVQHNVWVIAILINEKFLDGIRNSTNI